MAAQTMVVPGAYRPRLRLSRPSVRPIPVRSRTSATRLRPGSLAWWACRLIDPQDLLGLKVVLAVAVFAAGGLIGP